MQLEGLTSFPTSGSPVSSSTVVEYLDVFIVVVIVVFSLFNVPRALVYAANNRFEVFKGCLLRLAMQFRMRQPPSVTTAQPEEKAEEPLGHSTPNLELTTALRVKQWHLPMCLSLRHPAAGFMKYRLLGNHSVLQVALMAGYTAAVFCAAFYQSNPFSQPQRAGWVVASQIPFVYAFATKNNMIGLFVGVGYEKLSYLHRHVGRLMVIGANVHAIGYIYKWILSGRISRMIAEPNIRWGLVGLVCFDLLGFFSVQYVRTKAYNLFVITHSVALIMTLFAVCIHQATIAPYVIAASVVYGLDHTIRAIKTRFTTATLRTIPELGLTRLDIPSLSTGWRAGQHVRLRVLSTAMGLWGMTEVHPFTISSATNTEEGMVLMCKKTGSWTEKLYEMAQTIASNEQGQEHGRRVKVMIEGPYGGVGDITVPNYSGAMFVAGGSGITFALSAVQDLVLAGDRSRAKVIEVIWCITNPAALEHFLPLFSALVSQGGPSKVRISVFYTRVTARPFEGLVLPSGITLTAGRPNIRDLLDGFVTSMMSKCGRHGGFVAVCGPVDLRNDTADAVRTCNSKSKRVIGGIEFHEEVFGW